MVIVGRAGCISQTLGIVPIRECFSEYISDIFYRVVK
jgi:hypothetical protein